MRLALVVILALLGACREFPELDAAVDDDARAAPYPDLLPAEALRGRAGEPRRGAETRRELEERAAALRGRAEALRGGVVDAGTRARMETGVE